MVGVDRDQMVGDAAGAVAGQVEIGVVGQVNDGGLVGARPVIDLELVGGMSRLLLK